MISCTFTSFYLKNAPFHGSMSIFSLIAFLLSSVNCDDPHPFKFSLSERIQMDLQHISGDLIVRGDMDALSNLVHIFVRIVSMTRYPSAYRLRKELARLL